MGPIGAVITTSQDEEEYGKSPGLRSRIQRRIDTAMAIAGDAPPWIDAFLTKIERLFGVIVLNPTVNSMLDGEIIHRNQKREC